MNLEPRKTIGAPPPPSDYRSTAHKKTPNLSDGRRGATRGRYLGNTIAIVFRPCCSVRTVHACTLKAMSLLIG